MSRVVSYDYYTDNYHGTKVEEGSWDHYSQLASAYLDKLKTLVKVTPYGNETECESMAICRMAEAFQTWEAVSGASEGAADVTHERIGSVDETYASKRPEDVMPGGLYRALVNAISPWLHVCVVVG